MRFCHRLAFAWAVRRRGGRVEIHGLEARATRGGPEARRPLDRPEAGPTHIRLEAGTTRVQGLAILFSGLCLAMGSGCGYQTTRPFPADIQTVHVEMLESREFRRELEFRLTESLIKRIEMDTPYRIAPKETADAVFTGEIIEVRNRTFGNDIDTDLPREIGSTIVMRFRFKDVRTGKILVDRQRFVHQTSYIPPAGETFYDGMTRAMDGLAERIVETMETDW